MCKISRILFVVLLASLAGQPAFAQTEDTLIERIIIEDEELEDNSSYDTSLFSTAEIKPVEGRIVPRQKIDELKKDDAFWYANAEREKPKPAELPVWQKGWFKTIMWIVIIATFIAIIILFLSSSNVFLFRRQSKKLSTDEEMQELNEDIFSIDYEKEIQKAINSQNYRLAIRYLYLRTLRNLSEKGIIKYSQEKTDQDYVMQLFGTEYYKDFFRITRDFEYAWYGQFPISAHAFEVVQSHFDQFKTRAAA
jgi:hypothetical protein